ncbi:DUF1902 domain-containing protein [Methyloferula stellata]|jgi:hypothetical protein|uniref:DUF1902 domain-containing protein n=1 Tax=Methyloferula stellata TaxID=876270 RepID=UPI0003736B9A|nr:DUF1902 domain-containing protein [Methyloferula stellata]
MRFVVHVEFDPEHKLYFVHESDIAGLTVEASSVDQLIEVVRDVGPDLLGEQAAAAEYDFLIHLPAAA